MLHAALPATEILNDRDDIINAIRRFQDGTIKFWSACVDSSLPAFSVGKVKEGHLAAKRRGVRIMYITEITKENLPHCKEIMGFAELRHLKGARGNFAVSETEYVAGVKRGDYGVSLIRSDAEELVRQQRLVFETLWEHAVPTKEAIAELGFTW